MPSPWTIYEQRQNRTELTRLYVDENLTINEIADQLNLSSGGVYYRIKKLGLPSLRYCKPGYNNVRQDINIPARSAILAELIGALLGDGHLTPTQVTLAIGKKDKYEKYSVALMGKVFGVAPRVYRSKKGDSTVYVGSVKLVRWLLNMGLSFNKVRSQVSVPRWIMTSSIYMRSALRGLIDTDGSVYRLKFGCQISFRNRSIPLLHDVRAMLMKLGFHPSSVTGFSVYLTRGEELIRFAREIGFGNRKHLERFNKFVLSRDMQVDKANGL